jgi:two-component system OmpR family sensor kinase
VVVFFLTAIVLNYAFRQLLLEQAQLRVTATSDEIAQQIDQAQNFGFFETPVLAMLTDRANLDHWESPSTYVQIDRLDGLAIGKSSNMGSVILPFDAQAIPHDSDRAYQVLTLSDSNQVLVMDRVLFEGGRPVAIALVAERLDTVRILVRRARTILIVAALLGTIVVVAASFFIARTAIDPILRLTEAMAEIGSDRLDRRITSTRTDEVGKLAAAFNAMLARLQEAFARERQFISDASHELKTPLTVINANAQMLARWGNRDENIQRESLAAIVAESAQLADMVSGMLTLAKADSGDAIPREPLVLETLVSDVVAHAHERAERKGLTLRCRLDSHGTIVVADAGLLRQLVNNLIDNAIKFTENGGIDVTVRRKGPSAGIEVADSGIGIEPEIQQRLFDRFFRGDASHTRAIEGTGLGLAIVRSIARVHGGRVEARPNPQGGSIFTVTLPALDELSSDFNDPPAPPPLSS